MTIAGPSTMLGVPGDTLYGWRHRGEGPGGTGLAATFAYRRSSVEAWLEEQADRRQRRSSTVGVADLLAVPGHPRIGASGNREGTWRLGSLPRAVSGTSLTVGLIRRR